MANQVRFDPMTPLDLSSYFSQLRQNNPINPLLEAAKAFDEDQQQAQAGRALQNLMGGMPQEEVMQSLNPGSTAGFMELLTKAGSLDAQRAQAAAANARAGLTNEQAGTWKDEAQAVIDQRRASAGLTDVQRQMAEEELPYAASRAKAEVRGANAGAESTEVNTEGARIENSLIKPRFAVDAYTSLQSAMTQATQANTALRNAKTSANQEQRLLAQQQRDDAINQFSSKIDAAYVGTGLDPSEFTRYLATNPTEVFPDLPPENTGLLFEALVKSGVYNNASAAEKKYIETLQENRAKRQAQQEAINNAPTLPPSQSLNGVARATGKPHVLGVNGRGETVAVPKDLLFTPRNNEGIASLLSEAGLSSYLGLESYEKSQLPFGRKLIGKFDRTSELTDPQKELFAEINRWMDIATPEDLLNNIKAYKKSDEEGVNKKDITDLTERLKDIRTRVYQRVANGLEPEDLKIEATGPSYNPQDPFVEGP